VKVASTGDYQPAPSVGLSGWRTESGRLQRLFKETEEVLQRTPDWRAGRKLRRSRLGFGFSWPGGTIPLQKISSKKYCVGLRFCVW
jgi:hypothetical protein